MIKVQVRSNEPLEAALRRFKRQCNYAGIFRLAKKASVYEKPSEKRRRENRERIRNIQRQIRKSMMGRVRRRPVKRYGSQKPEGTEEATVEAEVAVTETASPAPAASE